VVATDGIQFIMKIYVPVRAMTADDRTYLKLELITAPSQHQIWANKK